MSLTPKQEKFVCGIVSGLSQREAYKQAYNTTKMKDETIDVKASQLFKLDKIKVRYNELLKDFKEKAFYDREKMVDDLIWVKEQAKDDIQRKGVKHATATAFISAVKELGVLNNLYPVRKQDINVAVNNPFKELSTDELKKLIADDG